MRADVRGGVADAWRKYRLPAMAAALGLSLTAVAWFAADTLAERQARERFDNRTHRIQEAVARRLEDYIQVLRAGASLFRAAGPVSRSEWRAYVEGLSLTATFPGFQGLGYSVKVPLDELARHEAAVRAEGFPDYAVHPDHPRPEYFAIVYLEPFDWRNQRAFGFDMFTEPVRHAAMVRARDSAQPAMSGRVTLVQETDEDVQAGFLIYYPVYRSGGAPDGEAARRSALQGFVYSPVRMDNLMRGVLGPLQAGIDFDVYDGTQPSGPRLMYSTLDTAAVRGRFSGVRTLDVAGHQWTLVFFSRPDFDVIADRWWPLLLLGTGLLVSGLLFTAVRSSTARRYRDIAYAHVVESALDGIVTIDEQGTVLEFNAAAEALFGYRREQAIGRDMSELIVPPHLRERHRAGMQRFADTGEVRILGRLIETEALRADGTTFPAEVTVTRVGDSRPPVFSGFIRDISERKAQERRLHELNAALEVRVVERTAQLEAANRELEAFAYSVSHDLRAPLRAIGGYSERLAAEHDRMGDDARHALSRIRAGVARMGQLIDDLLALSRVARLQLRRVDVDLSELAREVVADLCADDPARRVDVTIEDTPVARADPRLMRIVIENLLGNAWKFTARRADARIRFGARVDDGAVTYFVRDDGAGFDPARSGRLFQPFHRFHSQADFPGTGIGLATVARIIGRHGGRLRADAAVDKGATFFFTVGA